MGWSLRQWRDANRDGESRTEIANGAASGRTMCAYGAVRCAVLTSRMVLPDEWSVGLVACAYRPTLSYAMSGTDIAYGPTSC
eukprot:3586873-Rhodomonas_salina.3